MSLKEKFSNAVQAAKESIAEKYESAVDYFYGDFIYIIMDEPRDHYVRYVKVKGKLYALKYHVSQPFKQVTAVPSTNSKIITCRKKAVLKGIKKMNSLKHIKSIKQRVQKTSEFPFFRKDSPPSFPVEIWLRIAYYLPQFHVLLRVNKELCDIFAPIVYGHLKLFLTISSTDKMRLNDENYLTYGKDFLRDKVKGYPIYERNQKGKMYDYHFLDIARRKQFIERNDPRFDSNVVTKYHKVMYIINEIIKNPNSILRKYIENLSFSVYVLRGFNDLFDEADGSSDALSSDIFDTSLENKVIRCTPESYTSFDLPETFNEGDRRDMMWRAIWADITTRHQGTFLSTLSRKKFPTEVYSKELVGASKMLRFAQDGGYAQKLHQMKSTEDIHELNPYNIEGGFNERVKTLLNDEESSVCEYLSLSVESLDNFTTKESAQNLIKSIITTLMDSENSKTMNSKILISGQLNDSQLNPDSSTVPGDFRLEYYNYRPTTVYEPVLYCISN